MKNFYSILDVSPNATKDQIKLQYRKLVREFHPDQFLEPHIKQHYEEKLKEVNEAYTMVTQANFTTGSYGSPEVKQRYSQLSPFPMSLGIASLSVLIFFIITLLPIFAMGASETTEATLKPEVVRVEAFSEPSLHQVDRSSTNISNYISKATIHTPKLGATVRPIDPLRIQAISKNRK